MENEKKLTAEEILRKNIDCQAGEIVIESIISAMHEYASQFKPVTVSDKEIENMVLNSKLLSGLGNAHYYMKGLRDMRDKLTK